MKKYLLILFIKSHHHTVYGWLNLTKLTHVLVSGGKGEKKRKEQLAKRSILVF